MEHGERYTDKNGVVYEHREYENPSVIGKPTEKASYKERAYDGEELTLERLQELFPKKKKTLTQDIVDLINQTNKEAEFQGEPLLNTLVMYEDIMLRNKARFVDYVNAVKFCAYLVSLDDNVVRAYIKTFYHRKFVKERMNQPTDSNKYKELCTAASRYRRQNKLVNDILTVSQIPLDMMFMGYRYRAIGVLADRMENARLDRDRIAAAKELLSATEPKDRKIELEVGPSASAREQQDKLFDMLRRISYNQKTLLETGGKLEEVQKLGIDIVDVEVD